MPAMTAIPDAPARPSLDELHALMRAVSETTGRLEQTHLELNREVARLKSELADANAKLGRSQQLAALGEMAAGIAHEIRNPLGSIQLYLQMLREDLEEQHEQVSICRKIECAVTGIDTIVRDVLAFARDMRLEIVPIPAEELLKRTIAVHEPILRQAEVTVQQHVAENLIVTADLSLMPQALGNLIRNAIDAMTEPPCPNRTLVLSAARSRVRCPDGARRQRVVLAVHDSGPGIETEVVRRMFNPFFTTRRAGTGLGLAIVHRIVDAHGGHVNVSNHPEGGAVVELCLPVQRKSVSAAPGHDAVSAGRIEE